MTTPNDLMTDDDRLDAIALIRAHINQDAAAMRVILQHAGQGTYLAVVHLTAALVEAHAEGSAHQYLDDLADSVRGTQHP